MQRVVMCAAVLLGLILSSTPAAGQVTIGRYRVNGSIDFSADLQIQEVVPMTTIPDPLLIYHFEETGAVARVDSSGNGYDFPYVAEGSGGTPIQKVSGKFGQADRFGWNASAPDAHLKHDVATSVAIAPTGSFSFDLWHRFNDDGVTNAGIFSTFSGPWTFRFNSSRDIIFRVNKTGGIFGFQTLLGITHDISSVLPLNEWHHLAATYDHEGKTSKLYIDGVEVASATHTEALPTLYINESTIGVRVEAGVESDLDELHYWRGIALTAEQVAALFNEGDGVELPLAIEVGDPQAAWQSDERPVAWRTQRRGVAFASHARPTTWRAEGPGVLP